MALELGDPGAQWSAHLRADAARRAACRHRWMKGTLPFSAVCTKCGTRVIEWDDEE